MKKFLLAMAMLVGVALPEVAAAQVVVQQPVPIFANSIVDFGNGPLEMRVLLGNAWLFTSQGSGTGTAPGTTALTLTASAAANPPCVGCIISGAGITSGTTVAAFNGTTGITLSAAMTVTAAVVSWGVACPAFSAGLPTPNIGLQAGNSLSDLPMYTQARICGYAANGPGAAVLAFPIGAH
jgi:hypothetical protein